MTTIEKTTITVTSTINAPVEKVWNLWTDPKHIIHWNNASDDWHTPKAENDLRVGGKFLARMEAKDGSTGFDFTGKYSEIELYKLINYTITGGRKVYITFESLGKITKVTESFEAEHINSVELQHSGWQSILNNFKKYAESYGKLELINFKISINASADIVFKTITGKKTYSEWTEEFNPASHFVGTWEKGSKILFLGTDRDGSMGGMVSRIKENIPYRFISIEHLGIVQKGKEITSGPKAAMWAGALENYTFKESKGKTMLLVDIDANQEFKTYLLEMWPGALKKLKSICER
jgi:uncharacterized protein YndB with AHSA1/START domain